MAQGGANGRRQSARVVHVVDEEKFGPTNITWWTIIINESQNLKKFNFKPQIKINLTHL